MLRRAGEPLHPSGPPARTTSSPPRRLPRRRSTATIFGQQDRAIRVGPTGQKAADPSGQPSRVVQIGGGGLLEDEAQLGLERSAVLAGALLQAPHQRRIEIANQDLGHSVLPAIRMLARAGPRPGPGRVIEYPRRTW